MWSHESHRSGDYSFSHVSIGSLTNHALNFFLKVRWNPFLTPVLLSYCGYSSVVWEVFNIRAFQTVMDFESFISSFPDLDHALTIERWFAMCLQSSIFPLSWSSTLSITSLSVHPNLVVSPTLFSFSKCGGIPIRYNHDYLHTYNISSALNCNENPHFVELEDLQPAISTPLYTRNL